MLQEAIKSTAVAGATEPTAGPDGRWLLDRTPARGARGVLRSRKLCVGLLCLLVAVYVLNLTSAWTVGKDGALYLLLGRNLAEGRGYTQAGIPHTHVVPGFPLMLAGLMKCGANDFLALNIAMGLMGLAVVALSYLLLRTLVDRDWAMLGAITVGLSQELVQRSGEIISDVPFMLLVVAGLWLLAGREAGRSALPRWLIGAVLLAAACWVRLPGVPLAIGAAVGLVLANWRRARLPAVVSAAAGILLVAATMVTLTYFFRTATDPTAATYSEPISKLRDVAGMPAHVMENLLFAAGQLSRLLTTQRMPEWLCAAVLVVPIVAAMIARARRGEWVTVLATACYVGGLLVATLKVRTRYLLPISPLLVMYFLEGWAMIALAAGGRMTRLRQVRWDRARDVAFGLAVVMVLMNLVLVGRLVVRKHGDDYTVSQQDGQWGYLPGAVEFLRSQPAEGSVIGPYAVGYLSRRPVPGIARALVASRPDDAELTRLLTKWNAAFVVLDAEAHQPLHDRLREYLTERTGGTVYETGQVQIYAVACPAGSSPAP